MNNFSCTIWQFLMFGFTCLCGGISLGVTIDRYIWKREIEDDTPRNNLAETSQDCVKREDVKSGMIKYGFLAPDMTVTEFVDSLPSVTPSIPDVENNFNLGYNCGYADAMSDIAESEE